VDIVATLVGAWALGFETFNQVERGISFVKLTDFTAKRYYQRNI
jgi:hypothetical protein